MPRSNSHVPRPRDSCLLVSESCEAGLKMPTSPAEPFDPLYICPFTIRPHPTPVYIYIISFISDSKPNQRSPKTAHAASCSTRVGISNSFSNISLSDMPDIETIERPIAPSHLIVWPSTSMTPGIPIPSPYIGHIAQGY